MPCPQTPWVLTIDSAILAQIQGHQGIPAVKRLGEAGPSLALSCVSQELSQSLVKGHRYHIATTQCAVLLSPATLHSQLALAMDLWPCYVAPR